MTGRLFDLAVLGAGPAGLLTALGAARHADVALVVDRLPAEDDPPRVEAIPARVLALFIEFGIDPRALGVDRLHDRRWVAWSTAAPRVMSTSPAAHVERPHLDRVLLSHALSHRRIALFLSKAWAPVAGVYCGDGWRARRLVDATGRAAVTAASVIRHERPWAARTLCRSSERDGRGPPFALAPLPDGYSYRIEGRRLVVIGFVGRGLSIEGPPARLEENLRSSGGGWMIDDLPSLSTFDEGRASPASVQWAIGLTGEDAPRPLRIGDAALSRDPLSSQGIAVGCSEAMFAVSARSEADLEVFETRQVDERQAHFAALAKMIEGCRFSSEPAWRDYSGFVARHARAATTDPPVALRHGKVVRFESTLRHRRDA
jgi:flavin-dependent dehydrogenase